MSVGSRIKKIRKERGLTQSELAELVGVKTVTIRKYESDEREPNLETLKKICASLNATMGEIISGVSPCIISGKKLKATREKFNLSIKDLSEKTNISVKDLNDFENNQKRAPLLDIISIGNALKISIDDITESFNLDTEKFVRELFSFSEKYIDLNLIPPLDVYHSILLRDPSVDIDDVKLIFNNTVLELITLAEKNKKLNYTKKDFSSEEISEISDFIYNAYTLKIDEILKRHE